jgi:hypothetical protein
MNFWDSLFTSNLFWMTHYIHFIICIPINTILNKWSVSALLSVYIIVQRMLRFRIRDRHEKMYNLIQNSNLKLKSPHMSLDDAGKILQSMLEWEMPLLSRLSLELGQFRTFGIPSIGNLLASTDQYTSFCSKRYDDTDLILREMIENGGPHTPRGLASVLRLNEIHAQYPTISNDDFLYTLSVFVVQPARFMESYEWRPLITAEQEALYLWFADLGKRMHIKNIPDSFKAMCEWHDNYEAKSMRYAKGNQRVANATLDLLCSAVERAPLFSYIFQLLRYVGAGSLVDVFTYFPRKVVRHGAISMMDARLREACGCENPNWILSLFVKWCFTLRRFLLNWGLPRLWSARRTAFYDTNITESGNGLCTACPLGVFVPRWHAFDDIYKDGYEIKKLGATRMKKDGHTD